MIVCCVLCVIRVCCLSLFLFFCLVGFVPRCSLLFVVVICCLMLLVIGSRSSCVGCLLFD